MNRKHTWKKTAALLLALGLTLGATGCDFLVPDNVRDLEQVVATVDISDRLAKENETVAGELDELIEAGALSTDVYKRDLVADFLSNGYSYVQSGYSYKDVFNMLMDNLTGRKIVTQYAVAYYIEKGINNPESVEVSLDAYKKAELDAVTDAKEKALLEAHPEVLTMKYYLTDFGKTDAESMKDYHETVYSLKKSLNNSLDSAEGNYIKASEDGHTHEDTRTTPKNANTLKSDYVPMDGDKLNYDIYTGRNALDSCGEYEKVAGSTKSTRMKAYNVFLSNLQSYGLVESGENAAKITQLNYYYEELSSVLGLALVNKYYDELQDKAIGSLTETKVLEEYNSLLKSQKSSYTADHTAFETALDSKVSDTAFLLYGLEDYGYVYNILIPFTEAQNQLYSAAKNKYADEELFNYRKDLLAQIEAKDLRSAWFCTEDAEHYAYEVETAYDNGLPKGDKTYLFFEDNATNNDKYEKLTQYAGNYPYNGIAGIVDGEWKFTPNKMKVVGDTGSFLDEFEDYVSKTANVTFTRTENPDYGKNYYKDEKKTEIDYNAFVYCTGKFNLTQTEPADFFNAEKDAYQALSAVNELMFAYSTDTGCLNTYMGYSVNAHKTSFVSEFEYAAQAVVKSGVGSYAVVPSDYGWHIIYCSYAFNKSGEIYGLDDNGADGYVHADREKEGTFSYLFYEALKSTSATTQSASVQSALIKEYEDSVELFTDRYQDLLDIE